MACGGQSNREGPVVPCSGAEMCPEGSGEEGYSDVSWHVILDAEKLIDRLT